MRRVACMVLAGGCSFHPTAAVSTDDAAPGDVTTTTDGGDATTSDCWGRWMAHDVMFSTPTALANINTSDDDRDPWVSVDQKTMLLASDRNGSAGKDIYVAERTAITDDFNTPVKATAFNSADDDSKASMTADGLIAVVNSRRTGGSGATDIWIARRASVDDPLTFDLTGMAAVNNADEQRDAEISADGKTLYYTEGSGPQHVMVSVRATVDSPWGTPLDVVHTADDDGDPTVSPDGLVIVFKSQRSLAGFAKDNIWYATRSTFGAAFGAAMPVPGVNSADNDGDPSLTPDGCRLYLSNDSGPSKHTIYVSDMVAARSSRP